MYINHKILTIFMIVLTINLQEIPFNDFTYVCPNLINLYSIEYPKFFFCFGKVIFRSRIADAVGGESTNRIALTLYYRSVKNIPYNSNCQLN